MKNSEVLDFLKELSLNNDRDWFNANKERYLEIKAHIENLTQQMLDALSEVNPEARRLRVSDCTYRIYRDTRFSSDKTPYKTHIGIFMNPPGGKKSMTLGHYLHLEPNNSFYCVGTIGLPSPVLKAIRKSIYDDIEEYRSIVEDSEFKSLYPTLCEDYLKTAPQGFSKDWEYIDYVRPKNFLAVSGTLGKRFLDSPKFIDRLKPYMQQGERFNQFINYTVEDFL